MPSLWFFSPIIGLSFISSPCLWMLGGPRDQHSAALTSFLLYPHSFSRARWADRKSCGLNNLWLKIPKYPSPSWIASLNSRLSYLAVPLTRAPGWLSISKLTCPKQFLNLPSKPVLPVTQVKNLEVTLDLASFSHTIEPTLQQKLLLSLQNPNPPTILPPSIRFRPLHLWPGLWDRI